MKTSRNISLRLSPDKAFDNEKIRKALCLSSEEDFIITRRSIDARRSNIVVDISCTVNPESKELSAVNISDCSDSNKQAIVVGSGPAGLFAAMTLMENGIRPVIIERGYDVHTRRKHIALISTQGIVNNNSNYSFGEGGAGTYSDGKLYTRSHKRGDNDKVLGTFAKFGASNEILYDSHPHIGTDKLPKIVENIRNSLISNGATYLFNTLVTGLIKEGDRCIGVIASNIQTGENSQFYGPVILAIGNAARDTFRMLLENNVSIEAKDIAVGVRLEHPQHIIDCMQYHNREGRGKFLPPAEYSFSTQVKSQEYRDTLGVYSFCMCPGGFVVPAASSENQIVVNGMSPSNRGSVWANSGIVVQIPSELINKDKDPLSVVNFQQKLEEKTFIMSGKSQKAPAQRMTDFLKRNISKSAPSSSYAPGITLSDIREIFPYWISDALADGLTNFCSKVPMFLTEEAILIGTETRTSSPVRIVRNKTNLESVSTPGLYPCGEGAGYAGGIVSAAIDGMRCAEALSLNSENFSMHCIKNG